tara:strand:+ start:352 stop:642 length:291 start_codon:yes stop_codon:yes gene_type:complete
MKGYIYTLTCKDTEIKDYYIGSTLKPKKRMNDHRYECSTAWRINYDYKVYQFIRQNGFIDNWEMNIIEEVEITDRKELSIIERKYINEDKPQLNTH